AQIDEQQVAVVALLVDPTRQANLFADVFAGQLVTVMRTVTVQGHRRGTLQLGRPPCKAPPFLGSPFVRAASATADSGLCSPSSGRVAAAGAPRTSRAGQRAAALGGVMPRAWCPRTGSTPCRPRR